MPKISVLIPVYNAEQYLNKCIQSVISQSLKNIEIIIINDGSNDSSLEIIKSFKDERIKLFNKKNSGYGASLNLAINNAQGEYISILEADDFMHENMLETLYDVDAISTAPKAALLKVKKIPGVHYTISAIGLNQKDNHVFINAMKQFLDPIDNPRYMLVRQNTNVKWWQQRDYHALPDIISENKEMANTFKNNWQKHIGYCQVIYTRTIEGRILMLKSRAKAYSSINTTYADKISRWSEKLNQIV